MKATRQLIPIAMAMLLPLAVMAQQAPTQPAPAQNAPAANPGAKEINSALTDMAAQFNATLRVDPALRGVVKPVMEAKTFEEALTATLKPLQNVRWRKVYLRDKMPVPDAPKLVAMVRAMMTMEATGIMMQEESGTKITSYVKGADVPAGYQAQLSKMSPAFKPIPIYVVFSEQAAVRDLNQVVTEMNSTNAGSASPQLAGTAAASLMSALGNMSDADRTEAGRAIVNSMMNLDSKTRVQFFSGMMNSFRNMTPEERDNMRNTFRSDHQTARDLGIRMGGPRMGGPRGGAPGQNGGNRPNNPNPAPRTK